MNDPTTRESGDDEPESPRTDAPAGEIVTEMLPNYDEGRQVTVYVPPKAPEVLIYAGDGEWLPRWGRILEGSELRSTMIVGVHGLSEEMARLHEYSPVFDVDRFAAHERFFVEDVRRWIESRFGVVLPVHRTAVFGYSAGGELALALGIRHPDVYGAVCSGSPGGGFTPYGELTTSLRRAYLFGGTREPYFLDNATRWVEALREAGVEVMMNVRDVSHGAEFWGSEFALIVKWCFDGI